MKSLIVTFSLASVALASLEPQGYVSPGSHAITPPPFNYLPPNSKGNYNQFRGGLVTPSKQYLAPNSQRSSNSFPPSRQYLSANQKSVVSPLPVSRNYVPASLASSVPSSSLTAPHSSSSQDFSSDSRQLSNNYLQPAIQHSSTAFGKPFAGGFSASLPLASTRTPSKQYLAANQRDNLPGYHYGSLDDAIPAKYQFEYHVNDNHGNDYSHQESRNGNSAQGMFSVLLPDGRRQIVHYDADEEGFKPRIFYEDTGVVKANQQYANSGPY